MFLFNRKKKETGPQPRDIEADERARTLTLDVGGVGADRAPVGPSNERLAEELVRRVNAEIAAHSLKGTKDYRHPSPHMGSAREWPPEGTRIWRTEKGFRLAIDGILPKRGDLFDQVELDAFFRQDGSLFWVESILRVYRPRLKVSDPYRLKWEWNGTEFLLVRATISRRVSKMLVEKELEV